MSGDAGLARISDLATHMQVCRATALKITTYYEERCGLRRAEGSCRKYYWKDIWELEGYLDVPSKDWRRMKRPLLKIRDIADANVYGRSERTIRRRAAEGTLNSIKLPFIGPRFRELEVEDDML